MEKEDNNLSVNSVFGFNGLMKLPLIKQTKQF